MRYLTLIKEYGGHPKGTVDKIFGIEEDAFILGTLPFDGDTEDPIRLSIDIECKIFKTKKEAEAFSKKLLQPVKKWDEGTYVVFLEGNIENNGFNRGTFKQISSKPGNTVMFSNDIVNTITGMHSVADKLKWFATKAEALKCSGELVNPKPDHECVGLKKGYYVVSIASDRDLCYPKNHVFKLSEEIIRPKSKYDNVVCTELDCNAHDNNAWSCENFREATPEEGKLYEHAKKPVDVTTYKIPNKELTVNNLVGGEIYWYSCSGDEFIGRFLKLNSKNRVIDEMWLNSSEEEYSTSNDESNPDEIKPATPYQKKWLLTCEKQNTFIPKEELDQYDDNGMMLKKSKEPRFIIGKWYKYTYENGWALKCSKAHNTTIYFSEYIGFDGKGCYDTNNSRYDNEYVTKTIVPIEEIQQYLPKGHVDKIPTKKEFEFNKWYKLEGKKTLVFAKENYKASYGFTAQNFWKRDFTFDEGFISKYNWIEATEEEVKDRLLKYTKKTYPVGSKWKEINVPYIITTVSINTFDRFTWRPKNNQLTNGQSIFIDGVWAEKITEPETKKNVKKYVSINTQEEWDFVIEKFNPRKLAKSNFTEYPNKKMGICIEDKEGPSNVGCFCNATWFNNQNYTEVTSQEWLDLNNYTFKHKYKEEFVLPEKWCVKVGNNENYDLFNTWRQTTKFGPYSGNFGYLSNTGLWQPFIPSENPEITLEQFKKYVLKSDVKETKTVETYKHSPLPKNEKYFKARVVKDILREDIDCEGILPDIIPKGSITWFLEDHKKSILKNPASNVHPEKNRYGANILPHYFEIIGEEDKVVNRETVTTGLETITQTTIDRNWYVKVSCQDEADALRKYLKSIGEAVHDDWDVFDDYQYVVNRPGTIEDWWVGNTSNIEGKTKKRLSDFLPNYPNEPTEEELCEHCEETILGCKSSTSTFLCEGSHCDEARDSYDLIHDPYPKKQGLLKEELIPLLKPKKEVVKKVIKPNYSLL